MTKEPTEEEEKLATELLQNMFKEADDVVKQMLTKQYKDVVDFKNACISKVVARVLESSPDVDSELAVALSFTITASEHLISSHPGAVAVLDKDDNTVDFEQ